MSQMHFGPDNQYGRSVLDDATWRSLTGPHAGFALGHGGARAYPADVSPFAAVKPGSGDRGWADLAALAGPGERVTVFAPPGGLPATWPEVMRIHAHQYVASPALAAQPDPEAVRLTDGDVPDMLDLVARTDPGPFRVRTIDLGTYLGIRRDGALIAMAGERMHPAGFTEISAVCTSPDHRGRGLARRLVSAVAAGISERGLTPYLHTALTNTNAIRVYEGLGFVRRREVQIVGLMTPA